MLITDIVKILTDSGIAENEANIEVRLLIEKFAGFGLIDIITGKKLDESKLELVKEKALYRARTHEPIQYITGEAYFMGEKFTVNPSVLIPRDETEILARKAIEFIKKYNFKSVLDMCTGSGCIACMIAKNTSASVLGADISLEAIETAFKNMENMKLFNRVIFRKSDIFSKINEDEKFDIIVSNPPYIPRSMKKDIQKEVTFEPDIALYTNDEKGIEYYEKIIKEAPKYLNNGGYIMFELGTGESGNVSELLKTYNFKEIEVIKDLAGIDRVITAKHAE